jgi:hypothetical protein
LREKIKSCEKNNAHKNGLNKIEHFKSICVLYRGQGVQGRQIGKCSLKMALTPSEATGILVIKADFAPRKFAQAQSLINKSISAARRFSAFLVLQAL